MAVSKGVSRAGFDVDIIGMVQFHLNYFTWKSNLNSEEYVGVYVTASHNPAEYNGIGFNTLMELALLKET